MAYGTTQPIPTSITNAFDLEGTIENVVQQSKGPLANAPQGGLILPAPTPATKTPNTRPQNVYSGRQSHYWTATPTTQGVTTLTAATIPPPTVARFNGNYSGTSNATCTVFIPGEAPVTASASAPAQANVANGAVTGGGSVSNGGRFTAPGVSASGVSCTIGGTFWLDGDGGAGATGYINCGGSGLSCSGTWILRRQ